nr:MAG TPA: hypothetical protein [Caudoviricetes sp.]
MILFGPYIIVLLSILRNSNFPKFTSADLSPLGIVIITS